MSPPRQRVGVLVSGSGSNLQALLDACRDPTYPAEVVVVVANVAGIYALERAQRAGIRTLLLEHRDFSSRSAFDLALVERLKPYQLDWICLAGFMRLLGALFLETYRGRVLNIHPSLLPAFPGLHAQRQALLAGVKISGCTVHRVDEGTDTGPFCLPTMRRR